jgi:acetamidase/formamidase
MPTVHYPELERKTLHGPFDRDLLPAVTIDSGDTVRLRTLDGGGEKRSKLGAPQKKFPEFNRDRDGGHALIGQIEVRGAEPGMSLEITINEIIPASWGWTSAGGFKSYWNERMGVVEGPERLHGAIK